MSDPFEPAKNSVIAILCVGRKLLPSSSNFLMARIIRLPFSVNAREDHFGFTLQAPTTPQSDDSSNSRLTDYPKILHKAT